MIVSLTSHIRIIYYPNDTINIFRIVDNKTNKEFKINKEGYDIICFINLNDIDITLLNSVIYSKFGFKKEYIEFFLKGLLDNNFLKFSNRKVFNYNILKPYKKYYPLHSLSLETTQFCNLSCLHCYGQFNRKNTNILDFRFIENIMEPLDYLNTYQINLTGGEFFTHPYYNDIFNLFKNKGYEITILSNGHLHKKIIKFLETNNDCFIYFKLSLDGFQDIHNEVRNNQRAYQNAIELLDYLNNNKNINTQLSFTINKKNISIAKDFKNYVYNKYHINMTFDLAFPTMYNNNNSEYVFYKSDFDIVNKQYPEYLEMIASSEKKKKNKYRCRGGIESAAISADKIFKVCIGAFHECFYFGKLEDNNIIDLWEYPPKNIKYFRKEKISSIKMCKKCKLQSKCNIVNCRLLAFSYTGNQFNPNPVICYSKFREII